MLIHTAEPAPFFDPVTETNERWLELQVHPERRRPAGEFPSFETLMAERDRLFARHPKTTFIAAHFAYHANDLARLGRLLDEHPNVVTETGAILAELGRQPRAARAFFIKYQDRILFGKDSYVPSEYPYFWRTFETADEYFDYYRDYHAFWKLYGLDLPDVVLQKLYYGNALRLVPGFRAADFPPVGAIDRVTLRPMARWLVTGGAGFIGSHLAQDLARSRRDGAGRRRLEHGAARQPRAARRARRSADRRPGRHRVCPRRDAGHGRGPPPGGDSVGAPSRWPTR